MLWKTLSWPLIPQFQCLKYLLLFSLAGTRSNKAKELPENLFLMHGSGLIEQGKAFTFKQSCACKDTPPGRNDFRMFPPAHDEHQWFFSQIICNVGTLILAVWEKEWIQRDCWEERGMNNVLPKCFQVLYSFGIRAGWRVPRVQSWSSTVIQLLDWLAQQSWRRVQNNLVCWESVEVWATFLGQRQECFKVSSKAYHKPKVVSLALLPAWGGEYRFETG